MSIKQNNNYISWLFTIKIRGFYYHFGFSNKPSGPGYIWKNIYYGRPCIHLGLLTIQLPIIVNKKIITAGKYTFRRYGIHKKKKLKD